MSEDPIKEAFSKVREDIIAIKDAINILSDEISIINRTLAQTDTPDRQTMRPIIQTARSISQTNRQKTQTVPQEEGGSKHQDSGISIGNQGVQTDRQTNRQTDRQGQKFALIQEKTLVEKDELTHIDQVSEVLDSLDKIKKTLRSQFKKLTPQEMQVFSTLYQLTDEGIPVDYAILSSKTSLSESSIRDYIQKLVKKGIPVDKTKENNKKVTLSIPSDFKRMASLQTILQLRGL